MATSSRPRPRPHRPARGRSSRKRPPTAARTSGRSRSDAIAACVVAFRRIIRVLRLSAQHTQQVAGVSTAQMLVIGHLRDGTPRSLNELAALTMTDRTSVAEVVQRLQERRLVRRATSSNDRRRAEITLTATGLAVLRRQPRNVAPLLVALRDMGRAELDQLADGLTRLTRALHADVGPVSFLFEGSGDASVSRRSRGGGARSSR